MNAKHPLSTPLRRRHAARRLAVWNGAVWALGNGLASTTLVIYLAGQLRSERFGLGVGFLLAAPQVVGLLRLATPAMLGRLDHRKQFCAATFFSSAAALAALPWLAAPGRLPSPGWSLAAMLVLWCLHHLAQYLGMVALWSWLADLARTRVRGRFLGLRQRWIVAGEAVGAIAAGLFVWGETALHPHRPAWAFYAVAAVVGAGFMAAAVVPLIKIPNVGLQLRATEHATACSRGRSTHRAALRLALQPFTDTRFLPFLAFGCWFSFFNGITQSAQHSFSIHVLGVSLLVSRSLETGMRVGQWVVSPRLGASIDRLGNRPVMIVCQLLVAAGMLFFAAATPAHWAWIAGAWACWIAYAGLNIGLPNWLLKAATPDENTSYIAAFDALRGVCYAASAVIGGAVVDRYGGWSMTIGGLTLGFFTCWFLFGWLSRSFGAALLFWMAEPAGDERS